MTKKQFEQMMDWLRGSPSDYQHAAAEEIERLMRERDKLSMKCAALALIAYGKPDEPKSPDLDFTSETGFPPPEEPEQRLMTNDRSHLLLTAAMMCITHASVVNDITRTECAQKLKALAKELSNASEPSADPAMLVEMELADDMRIFGCAFYRLVDGRKIRIHPKDVWIAPTGEVMTGPLSTAEPVLSVSK